MLSLSTEVPWAETPFLYILLPPVFYNWRRLAHFCTIRRQTNAYGGSTSEVQMLVPLLDPKLYAQINGTAERSHDSNQIHNCYQYAKWREYTFMQQWRWSLDSNTSHSGKIRDGLFKWNLRRLRTIYDSCIQVLLEPESFYINQLMLHSLQLNCKDVYTTFAQNIELHFLNYSVKTPKLVL